MPNWTRRPTYGETIYVGCNLDVLELMIGQTCEHIGVVVLQLVYRLLKADCSIYRCSRVLRQYHSLDTYRSFSECYGCRIGMPNVGTGNFSPIEVATRILFLHSQHPAVSNSSIISSNSAPQEDGERIQIFALRTGEPATGPRMLRLT